MEGRSLARSRPWWLALFLVLASACASNAPAPTLLDAYPDYRSFAAATASRHSEQAGQVAVQGCEALHRSYVAGKQHWVDCASGKGGLRIQLFELPDPKEEAEGATKIVSMIAMVESSWCLSHKLVLGNPDAVVTIVHPGGSSTATHCDHFMER